ncbi:shikimate dehydrogenase [Trichloromonas sp.]|uniref:shikimate dehydrogenase n=1 Tax=Trichloromonas sp. TaxID=3069249 RepID=UPI002A4BBD93|nr:shikimate dehydrogenase [Trichloromonas sp.]
MKISGTTRILGIFGDPVKHSLSPLMHNEALARIGFDAVYVPFHVLPEHLPQAVASIRILDLLGVNLTVPHKERVCPLLDVVDSQARLIGAVNTVVNRDGCLTGYNTDGSGFLRSLAEDLGFDPAGRRILLLGAGGACRAALVALAQAGAGSIVVANRTPERATALVAEFGPIFSGTSFASCSLAREALTAHLPGVDLLVNTSALGLGGESLADFPWKKLPSGAAVYDMVYGFEPTPLLRAAAAHGHGGADGLGMLAAQGEEGFRLWIGQAPPSGVMKAQLLAAVAAR